MCKRFFFVGWFCRAVRTTTTTTLSFCCMSSSAAKVGKNGRWRIVLIIHTRACARARRHAPDTCRHDHSAATAATMTTLKIRLESALCMCAPMCRTHKRTDTNHSLSAAAAAPTAPHTLGHQYRPTHRSPSLKLL